MNISIDRIKLQNFKGIGALEIEFGKETNIYGENATGKTTIFDAFLWALFGKDSLNSATFDIKPLDQTGNPAHNLEHSVEVSMSVDGQPFVVAKTYAEKWTKRRGLAAKEFTGHTTEYAINGVPLKEGEFKNRIKGLIDEGVFRLLTDPRYFNEVLIWQKRREILLKVCGNVSVAEIINGNPDLAGLTNLLSGATVDDLKRIIAAKKKDINEALEKLPVRIDEANLAKAEIRPDINQVPGMIASKEEIRKNLESKLADARNGGVLSAKRIELNNVTAEIQEARIGYERDRSALISPLNKELIEVQTEIHDLNQQRGRLNLEIQGSQGRIASLEKEIEDLRTEWSQIDAQEFTGSCQCPTCGQALPEAQVQAAKEKHNLAKAEKLDRISVTGKERGTRLSEIKAQIEKHQQDLQAIDAELPTLQAREAEIQTQIAETRAQQPDLSALEAKKSAIQAEIDTITASGQPETQGIQADIDTMKAEIKALNADLAKVESNKSLDKRISDLSEQQKKLAAEYEKVEAELFLIEKFIRAKVESLESRINAKFGLARFKMFADQINGGLQEVCETTLNGVPYSSINNAGRIQVGLDIIKTLQAHYGITAPIFVDNAESIVELPEIDCQLIRLIVSGEDKTLRIEAQPQTKKAA
ncbi:MAG: hypothetical protein ABFD81_18085 [Syntrophaceae bacterium]